MHGHLHCWDTRQQALDQLSSCCLLTLRQGILPANNPTNRPRPVLSRLTFGHAEQSAPVSRTATPCPACAAPPPPNNLGRLARDRSSSLRARATGLVSSAVRKERKRGGLLYEYCLSLFFSLPLEGIITSSNRVSYCLVGASWP